MSENSIKDLENNDFKKEEKSKSEVNLKLKLGFSIGEITDIVAYQGFSFLIFTFYAVIIGISVSIVTIVYIIWSLVNAFNDPILGAISDRTKTKRFGGGRRRPWITSMILPLGLVMVFLFVTPRGNEIISAIYMCFIMCLFDTIYTAYSINHTSLYPEIFPTDKSREEVGAARRILMVFGLLIAFILPSFVIQEYTGDSEVSIRQYQLAGLIYGIIIIVTGLIHVKYGITEPSYEEIANKKSLGFLESLKVTIKNRYFMIFVGASTMNWYIFTLLPLIMPVYVAGALGRPESMYTTLLLLIGFLFSIFGVIFWSKVDAKFGSKRAFNYSMIWWLISFIPLLFLTDYNLVMIDLIFIGIGLGGPTYLIDRNLANIIDEDEFKTNNRREASYFGIHAIFIRLAAILVIFSVNIICTYSGWEQIQLSTITEQQKLGLRILISIFPAIAMLVGILFLKFFPIDYKRQKELQTLKKGKKIE